MKEAKTRQSPLSLGLISLDFEDVDNLLLDARARGCEWVELYLEVNVQEEERESVARRIKDHGLRACSISSMAKLSQSEEALDRDVALIRGSIRMAAAIGAPFATFMYGSAEALEPQLARERFLERLDPLVSAASDEGVMLVIENVFSRNVPGDLDNVRAVVDLFESIQSPNVGLNFDIGNFAVAGEEGYPYAWRRLLPYVRYVHVKDVTRYVPDEHGSLGTRRLLNDHLRGEHIAVPLGTGSINMQAFLSEVSSSFSGPVALEPSAHGLERDEWLNVSLNQLAGWGLYGLGDVTVGASD